MICKSDVIGRSLILVKFGRRESQKLTKVFHAAVDAILPSHL